MNKKRLAVIILLSLLAVPALHPVRALGGVTLTAPTRSSVSVDGIFQAKEWSDGTHLAFNWASNNSTLNNAGDVWVKTNGTYLLVAVGSNGRTTINAGVDTYVYTLSLLFDNDNNGIIDNNEDAKNISVSFPNTGCSGELYNDLHYDSVLGAYALDQYVNGTACGSNSNPGASGTWSWEFAMPLRQDPAGQDFNLVQNASIGMDIVYSEQHYRSGSFISSGWAYWETSYPNGLPTGTSPTANGWADVVWTNLNAPITDNTPPTIATPTISPTSPTYSDTVTVSVNVTDTDSGVKNVSITYTTDTWKTTNKTLTASYNINTHIATAQIPPLPYGGHVEYYIIAFDNAGNKALNNNSGNYFTYDVTPPWYLSTNMWLLVILALAVIVALFAIIYPKRHKRSTNQSTAQQQS